MRRQEYGQAHRTSLVCIDTCADGVWQGRFYHPYHKDGFAFRSLTQLLLKMEETLDAMSFPQSFTAMRGFNTQETAPELEVADVKSMTGQKATFTVRILFRQNASWQGSVRWVEGGQEQSFRSALELIFLMDSVLK